VLGHLYLLNPFQIPVLELRLLQTWTYDYIATLASSTVNGLLH
jgi:hypothetical protein